MGGVLYPTHTQQHTTQHKKKEKKHRKKLLSVSAAGRRRWLSSALFSIHSIHTGMDGWMEE